MPIPSVSFGVNIVSAWKAVTLPNAGVSEGIIDHALYSIDVSPGYLLNCSVPSCGIGDSPHIRQRTCTALRITRLLRIPRALCTEASEYLKGTQDLKQLQSLHGINESLAEPAKLYGEEHSSGHQPHEANRRSGGFMKSVFSAVIDSTLESRKSANLLTVSGQVLKRPARAPPRE